MTDKCQPEQRFDLQLAALKEFVILKDQALQAEYSKSELNYPTRQQLNEEMGKLLSKDEANLKFNDVYRLIKILIAFTTGIILTLIGTGIAFLMDYWRR